MDCECKLVQPPVSCEWSFHFTLVKDPQLHGVTGETGSSCSCKDDVSFVVAQVALVFKMGSSDDPVTLLHECRNDLFGDLLVGTFLLGFYCCLVLCLCLVHRCFRDGILHLPARVDSLRCLDQGHGQPLRQY